MHSPTSLSENWEDYLERIHELNEAKGYARVADIAQQLDIASASVTSMVQKMAKAGLLNYERYRGLTLTPTGEAAALGFRHRHRVLTSFLTLLGVPADVVARSRGTFAAWDLRHLREFTESRPELRAKLLQIVSADLATKLQNVVVTASGLAGQQIAAESYPNNA